MGTTCGYTFPLLPTVSFLNLIVVSTHPEFKMHSLSWLRIQCIILFSGTLMSTHMCTAF